MNGLVENEIRKWTRGAAEGGGSHPGRRPSPLNGSNGGHFFNGQLKNLNLLYGDAHVGLHKLAVVLMQYQNNNCNFY